MWYESNRIFIKAGESLLFVEISWHFTTFFVGFVWLSECMVTDSLTLTDFIRVMFFVFWEIGSVKLNSKLDI